MGENGRARDIRYGSCRLNAELLRDSDVERQQRDGDCGLFAQRVVCFVRSIKSAVTIFCDEPRAPSSGCQRLRPSVHPPTWQEWIGAAAPRHLRGCGRRQRPGTGSDRDRHKSDAWTSERPPGHDESDENREHSNDLGKPSALAASRHPQGRTQHDDAGGEEPRSVGDRGLRQSRRCRRLRRTSPPGSRSRVESGSRQLRQRRR